MSDLELEHFTENCVTIEYIMSRRAPRSNSYHVLHNGDAWVIRAPRQAVARSATTGRFVTQLDAVKVARAQAKKSGAELVIHGRDGRIRDVDSYSNKASVGKLVPMR